MKNLILLLLSVCIIMSCRKKGNVPIPVFNDLKPQASGLSIRDFDYIVRNPQTDIEILKTANSIVVKVPWRNIQPDEDGAIKHPNSIDSALDYVRKQNRLYPDMNMCLRIRIHCGILSPSWVKSRSGSFILYTDLAAHATSPQDSLMPKFWDPSFLNAFASFQNKLSAIYDTVPEIREVINGGTGVFYAESFIRNASNNGVTKTNSINFINAGWTAEKDLSAIRSTIDAMKAWKQTRISMAFNEFINIAPPPGVYKETQPTKDMIDYMVATLKEQAILGNNGLRDDNAEGAADWLPGGMMYDISEYMRNIHFTKKVPVYYQTATAEKISSLKLTIEKGIQKGAACIELPGPPHQFTNYLSLAELKKYDAELESQASN